MFGHLAFDVRLVRHLLDLSDRGDVTAWYVPESAPIWCASDAVGHCKRDPFLILVDEQPISCNQAVFKCGFRILTPLTFDERVSPNYFNQSEHINQSFLDLNLIGPGINHEKTIGTTTIKINAQPPNSIN